jgi:hypothetical protein
VFTSRENSLHYLESEKGMVLTGRKPLKNTGLIPSVSGEHSSLKRKILEHPFLIICTHDFIYAL